MTALLLLSPLILLAAFGAVWRARPVHAALLLALCLSLIAVLYLSLGADFIGLVQFSVYVGAVAVLIVFALLITRPGDEGEEKSRRMKTLIPGLICSLPVLLVLLHAASTFSRANQAVEAVTGIPVKQLGEVLFTHHAPAVLAVALLLTAVLIGAALFAREASHPPKETKD